MLQVFLTIELDKYSHVCCRYSIRRTRRDFLFYFFTVKAQTTWFIHFTQDSQSERSLEELESVKIGGRLREGSTLRTASSYWLKPKELVPNFQVTLPPTAYCTWTGLVQWGIPPLVWTDPALTSASLSPLPGESGGDSFQQLMSTLQLEAREAD